MTLNFVLIVEDAGELKTVTAAEFLGALQDAVGVRTDVEKLVDDSLNKVLDDRAISAGEYDPSDNDMPMVIL